MLQANSLFKALNMDMLTYVRRSHRLAYKVCFTIVFPHVISKTIPRLLLSSHVSLFLGKVVRMWLLGYYCVHVTRCVTHIVISSSVISSLLLRNILYYLCVRSNEQIEATALQSGRLCVQELRLVL